MTDAAYPDLSQKALATLLVTAVAAARAGARVAIDNFEQVSPEESTQKSGDSDQGHWNPVSEIDIAAEHAIVDTIKRAYPDHTFLGEENVEGQIRDAEHIWIIDPIDGTSNYLHGMPHFSVSVGYARNGEIQVAACLDPKREELFTAIRGGGAFLNGEPIAATGIDSLDGALITTGFYYDRGAMMERTLHAIKLLFQAGVHGIRRTGSCVLDMCWTAAGRFDGFFELQLGPWDFLPASLVATEAGAIVSTADGDDLGITSSSAICSSPGIHSTIVDLLDRSGRRE